MNLNLRNIAYLVTIIVGVLTIYIYSFKIKELKQKIKAK